MTATRFILCHLFQLSLLVAIPSIVIVDELWFSSSSLEVVEAFRSCTQVRHITRCSSSSWTYSNVHVPAMMMRSTRRLMSKSSITTHTTTSASKAGDGDAGDGRVSEKKIINYVVSQVEKDLKKSANSTKAKDMQRYLRTTVPMYGIQKPQRQQIEKRMYEQIESMLVANEEQKLGSFHGEDDAKRKKKLLMTVPLYKEFIRQLWSQEFRDFKYLAIDLAMNYKHCITFECLDLYEIMIRHEDMWWDLCDPIAINLVGMLTRNTSSSDGGGDGCKNNEYNSLTRLKPKILEWIQDEDNMWIRRTAILCQLKSKTSTDPDLLFDLCRRRMFEKEFFIQKAIGWSLREYAKTDPSAVIAFLQDEKKSLSRLSYREGSRILISKGLMTD